MSGAYGDDARNQGYQPQGGYPPQGGDYPPQQGGYPPQQGGYPPQQGYGGPPPQQGYGGPPPQQDGYGGPGYYGGFFFFFLLFWHLKNHNQIFIKMSLSFLIILFSFLFRCKCSPK